MGRVISGVVKPFAKILGIGPEAPSQSRLPAGHEWKKVSQGDPYYIREAQEGDRDERLTVAEANRLRGQGSSDNDPLQGFRFVENVKYQAVPVGQAAPAPAPAPVRTQPAPAPTPRAMPTSATAPATATQSVLPSPIGTPTPTVSPLTGGPQPSQPAQPSTPARPAVQAVSPRPVVSGVSPTGTTPQGVSRRRGRRPFVQTTSVGLTAPAQTQKKTLLGS